MQRRKIKGFGDFKRIAVVFIPDDDEYKQRLEKKLENEGKEVSEYSSDDMKGKSFFNGISNVSYAFISSTLHVKRYYNYIITKSNISFTWTINKSNNLPNAANFSIPNSGCWFDEVQFVGLDGEEAKKKVLEYNEQGKKALSSHPSSYNRGPRDHRRHRDGMFYTLKEKLLSPET